MLLKRPDFHRIYDPLLTLLIWLRREGWAFTRCPDSSAEWAKSFLRSTTAAAVLKEKQVMLQLPLHKLVQDVATRWNSSHDMLERYLEQQAAVFSALTDKSVKKNIKDIITLSDDDVKLAEDVVQVLKPLKTVTTLMSTEQIPTISMILPLKHRILASMKHSGSDSTVVKDIKAAIAHDFEDRYPDTDRALIQFLHMSTALDPRFRSLPFLDETTHDTIFKSLTERILDDCSQTVQVFDCFNINIIKYI